MYGNFVIDIDNLQPYTRGTGPIVIVDDDDSQLTLVKACYQRSKRSNELICIKSGEDFLDFLKKVKHGNYSMPELVLLDINMPKKSGFDVLQELRSQNEFQEVPVIIMFSCSESDSDKEMAKNLLANGFFSKPTSAADYIRFFQTV